MITEEEIERIKKKYKEVFDALEEYDRTHKLPKLKKPKTLTPPRSPRKLGSLPKPKTLNIYIAKKIDE